MTDIFELKEDAEVLFEINGNKIVGYETEAFISSGKGFGLRVHWWGSKGCGSFTYHKDFVDEVERELDEPKESLDTEYMGRDFCAKFMKHIFDNCEVEYEEEQDND